MKFDITDLNLVPFILMIIYFVADKYFLPLTLGKKQHIHKLQFEKEFEIYLYLWMKIAHFKRAAKRYFNLLPVDPDEESEFFQPFWIEWEDVYETITIREPFIAEEVFEQTDKLVELALEPLAKYKNPLVADQGELVKIRDEIFEKCDLIREAIRERIIV